MRFTLLLPSRGRVDLLAGLCRSVARNTRDTSTVEMLVGYDWDDLPTVDAVPGLEAEYPWLRCHGRLRGDSISRDYQNWLYGFSRGEYIFVLNDDVEILTYGWDFLAWQRLERFRHFHADGISYGWVNDSETSNRFGRDRTNPYSCFPILSRAAVDTLGYVMHEYYGGWSADVYTHLVYAGVDRVVNLSDIVVKHYTHWLGTRGQDDTTASMREKSTRVDILDPAEDIRKLRAAMRAAPMLL